VSSYLATQEAERRAKVPASLRRQTAKDNGMAITVSVRVVRDSFLTRIAVRLCKARDCTLFGGRKGRGRSIRKNAATAPRVPFMSCPLYILVLGVGFLVFYPSLNAAVIMPSSVDVKALSQRNQTLSTRNEILVRYYDEYNFTEVFRFGRGGRGHGTTNVVPEYIIWDDEEAFADSEASKPGVHDGSAVGYTVNNGQFQPENATADFLLDIVNDKSWLLLTSSDGDTFSDFDEDTGAFSSPVDFCDSLDDEARSPGLKKPCYDATMRVARFPVSCFSLSSSEISAPSIRSAGATNYDADDPRRNTLECAFALSSSSWSENEETSESKNESQPRALSTNGRENLLMHGLERVDKLALSSY